MPRGCPLVIATTICRPDISTTDMDDIRKSLSKLKKDFKHRLGSKKRGQDGPDANTAEERVGSSASPVRPGPRVEEGRASADVSQARLTDPSPYPEPVRADEDRLDDPQRKEVDVDKKNLSTSRSRVDPDIENAAGSGPNLEVKQATSPPSITPIAPKQEPDGS